MKKAIIDTEKGKMEVKFFEKDAPEILNEHPTDKIIEEKKTQDTISENSKEENQMKVR